MESIRAVKCLAPQHAYLRPATLSSYTAPLTPYDFATLCVLVLGSTFYMRSTTLYLLAWSMAWFETQAHVLVQACPTIHAICTYLVPPSLGPSTFYLGPPIGVHGSVRDTSSCPRGMPNAYANFFPCELHLRMSMRAKKVLHFPWCLELLWWRVVHRHWRI